MRLITLFLLVASAWEQAAEPEDVRIISVHRTPGKPMARFDSQKPAEQILAQREPEGYGLVVFVNVPRAGVKKLQGHRAVLTDKEWRGLVKIVSSQRLLDWKPEPVGGAVADWGEAGLMISASRSHAPTWIRPLKNASPPNALFKALVKMAREKLPDVNLYYLK